MAEAVRLAEEYGRQLHLVDNTEISESTRVISGIIEETMEINKEGGCR